MTDSETTAPLATLAKKAPLKERGRRGPGRPSTGEPQGEDLREYIISAAARIYGSYGYRNSTVDLIAKEAGVSRPLFYRLFKDRWEVIDIVIARANEALRIATLDAVNRQPDLLSALSTAIDAYFAWCQEHWVVVGPIYQELYDAESPAGAHRNRIVEDVARALRTKAAERGDAPLNPMLMSTLIGAVEQVGSQTFWPVPIPEEQVRANRAVLERIVIAAVARPEDNQYVPSLDTVRG